MPHYVWMYLMTQYVSPCRYIVISFEYLPISDIWGAIESNRMGKCMSKVHKPTRQGCERPTCPSSLSSPAEPPIPNRSGIICFRKVPGPTTVPFSQHQKRADMIALLHAFAIVTQEKETITHTYVLFSFWNTDTLMDISSTRRSLSGPFQHYPTSSIVQDISKENCQKAASDIPCRILLSLLIGALKISSQSRQRWTAGGHDSSLYWDCQWKTATVWFCVG